MEKWEDYNGCNICGGNHGGALCPEQKSGREDVKCTHCDTMIPFEEKGMNNNYLYSLCEKHFDLLRKGKCLKCEEGLDFTQDTCCNCEVFIEDWQR